MQMLEFVRERSSVRLLESQNYFHKFDVYLRSIMPSTKYARKIYACCGAKLWYPDAELAFAARNLLNHNSANSTEHYTLFYVYDEFDYMRPTEHADYLVEKILKTRSKLEAAPVAEIATQTDPMPVA